MTLAGQFTELPEGEQPQPTPTGMVTAPRPLLALVQQLKNDLAIVEALVRTGLEPTWDWGIVPGIVQPFLFESGAFKIMTTFNVYPGEPHIIQITDTDQKIAICVQVSLIDRKTGQVSTTGVGAASTLETRNKYRAFWDSDLKNQGYTQEEIDAIPKYTRGVNKGKRKLPNPETGELLNSLLKAACKRAEVDAVESLPGVATVLKKLFLGQLPPGRSTPPPPPPGASSEKEPGSGTGDESEGSAEWTHFWSEVTRLGHSPKEVHEKYGSMKDYVAKTGKPLAAALADVLQELRGTGGKSPEGTSPAGSAAGTELPKDNLAISIAWVEACTLLKEIPELIDEQLASWWGTRYALNLTRMDFTSTIPSAKLPPGCLGMIQVFIESMQEYKAARDKRSAKKGAAK